MFLLRDAFEKDYMSIFVLTLGKKLLKGKIKPRPAFNLRNL